MPGKAVVMLGHSHLNAIVEALRQRGPGEGGEDGISYYVHDVWAHTTHYADSDHQGGVVFNADVVAAIDRVVPVGVERHYVTLFGGNGHVVLALSRHPRPFDLVLKERPDLSVERGAEIVPRAFVQKVLRPLMDPYVWQLTAFRRAIGQRCLCLETPPPCGDDAYLSTHLGSYVPDPTKVIGRDMRMKMWMLHSQLLKAECSNNDIEFVAVPSECTEEAGFLNRAALGPDATHGNAWYGERLLRNLERKIGGKYAGWTQFTEFAS